MTCCRPLPWTRSKLFFGAPTAPFPTFTVSPRLPFRGGALLGSQPDRAFTRRAQESARTHVTASDPHRLISPRDYFAGEAEASPGRHDDREHGSNDTNSGNATGEESCKGVETPGGADSDDSSETYDEGESVDDAPEGDEKRGAFSRLASSWLTLALFSILVIGRITLQHVDIYSSPVAYAVSLPSYLVTMIFYDEGLLWLERLVYAVSDILPIDSFLLWEVGNVVTYYLVALLVTALYRWGCRAVA